MLHYIAYESRRFHTFVANRVSEIHEATVAQSAKRALKVVAGRQSVNDERLLTFMAEAEL